MQITSSHLLQIAPTTPVYVAAELFAPAREHQSVLDEILVSTAITEPRAVAMFLATIAYDSEGMTLFRGPDGQTPSPAEWVEGRARHWCDLNRKGHGILNNMAALSSSESFSVVIERFSYGTANFGRRRQYWRRACAALGVKINKGGKLIDPNEEDTDAEC